MDIDIVQQALQPHKGRIAKVLAQGFDDWTACSVFGNNRSASVPPMVINDFILQRAIAEFFGASGVEIVEKRGATKFVFDDRVVVRFKKGSRTLRTSNIPTQTALAFHNQQLPLPGIGTVVRVDAVYVPDSEGVAIEKLALVVWDGAVRVWYEPLSIMAESTPDTTPPTPAQQQKLLPLAVKPGKEKHVKDRKLGNE